ncbi:hypothetical protein A374_00115 [Fictibacillus macauensis ZFHKF-1]|uniref:Immunity protein Imm33 domain-containing protein n=1 Tax=Fictibacillus macauensis ZFHKF-1 TaxID=1196324 RepID=I8AN81_9BACL|nr:DUF2185 domain-containing protein [Fictibacillus macauensis]EIT87457.1 hypothetical protein A374_00115 [Fictibacillus macauensis ZFHKF-1]
MDNGWRIFSDIDTENFLADASNMSIFYWGTIFELEPAIMTIFEMPIGTELTLLNENNKKYFVYTNSGEVVGFQ